MGLFSRLPFTSLVACAAVGVSVAGYAQSLQVADTAKDGVVEAVSATSPIQPLTSTLQPTTPWPMEISQTELKVDPNVPAHNLLAYSGVDAAAQKLIKTDYEVWKSHFKAVDDVPVQALPQGLLMASGCQEPDCDSHKSLLIVSPGTQKVYAAMVNDGKMLMWPSLMSWPDGSIPALEAWLADATHTSTPN